MPLSRASSLFLPVLLLTGLALAAAIGWTAAGTGVRAADQGLYLADAGLGDRLESEEPIESASPDLHGDRGVGDGPGPLEEALRIDRRLPRPFSIAGDRPRARLPDRVVDRPVFGPGSSRLPTTFSFDRLLLTRLDGGANRGRACA